MKRRATTNILLMAALLTGSPLALAQFPAPPPRPTGPPPPAQQAATIDLTGYWVSVITEDWRWRMLTAPRGDIGEAGDAAPPGPPAVPVNAEGMKVANTFDATKYGPPWSGNIDCRAYYGAGLMRMPTRLHITWAGPNTLKIESDWGEQTRLIHFKKEEMPNTGPSAQGSSFAEWQVPNGGVGFFGFTLPPLPGTKGRLHVVTDNLIPGWLRRNGVPYGAKTRMTEWFQVFQDPAGNQWFDVTTAVEDPEYLVKTYVTSSDFRREPDGSKWSPHPCVKM